MFLMAVVFFLPGIASSSQKIVLPLKDDFPLPEKISLCGEDMPIDDPGVLEMFDRELTIAAWDRAQVFMWMKRSGRYFPYAENVLKQKGMPEDLKYVTLAESALLTHITSPVGAKGPWQFMKPTARKYGLRIGRHVDERLDFEKATGAALRYLKELKAMFGSWTLALAAYNCGESRVKRAIEEQNSKDYYRLKLPLETERYIFRIAAAKVIMEDPQRYGYRLPSERIYKPIEADMVQVSIRRPVRIVGVAEAMGIDYKALKDLNPHFLGKCLPTGSYYIKTPSGKGDVLISYLKKTNSIKYCKMRKTLRGYYRVRKGDTLTSIASKTGVSISKLKRLNKIKGSLVLVGQKLRIAP
jgi:hypothetical protein